MDIRIGEWYWVEHTIAGENGAYRYGGRAKVLGKSEAGAIVYIVFSDGQRATRLWEYKYFHGPVAQEDIPVRGRDVFVRVVERLALYAFVGTALYRLIMIGGY